jgi:DNA-binding MarR family transcriptional regulator
MIGARVSRMPEDEVLLELARTVVGVSAAAADRLGGVSLVQLRALTVLRRLGTATLGDLAGGMGVTVSTTSRLVDRLVAAGLVLREPAPHSRRELALQMTASGRALLERYDEDRLAALRAALHGVADQDAVLVAFAAFSAAMRPAEPAVAS